MTDHPLVRTDDETIEQAQSQHRDKETLGQVCDRVSNAPDTRTHGPNYRSTPQKWWKDIRGLYPHPHPPPPAPVAAGSAGLKTAAVKDAKILEVDYLRRFRRFLPKKKRNNPGT